MTTKVIGRIVLLVLAAACTYPAATAAGPHGGVYRRCLRSCNLVSNACDDRCVLGCAALFPNDPASYATCHEACRLHCLEHERECRQICRNADGLPPAEP